MCAGVLLKGSKLACHRETCMSIFIAALCTTANKCNQSRCSSTDEQTDKNGAMEFYSALEKSMLYLAAVTGSPALFGREPEEQWIGGGERNDGDGLGGVEEGMCCLREE